ncbi:MAG: dTMP kinase [Deltaproteobacteria bacterium]|nr:MAG: dTMP kinase [Deltaproteobacteria bacterium]
MSFFITLEGVEGSGKSTQIRILREHLEARGRRVLATREPGGCPIADAIRAILLDSANRELVPRAELLLYAAARAQHVEQVIRPALAAGTIVLCDRFADATTAYQGGGRGLDAGLIAELNRVATGGLLPDLSLLFDMPVETGLERARRRNQNDTLRDEGRFEMEELDFHRRVRSAYLALAERDARFRLVDATGTPATVAARVATAVDAFLAGGGPS